MFLKQLIDGADKGVPRMMCMLGDKYLHGDKVQRDVEKAKDLYQKAEDCNDPVGMVKLAHLFYDDFLIDSNYKEAAKHFKKAADIGIDRSKDIAHNSAVIDAMYHYGEMCYNGKGIEKDVTSGMYWMKLAADAGDPVAKEFLKYMQSEQNGINLF